MLLSLHPIGAGLGDQMHRHSAIFRLSHALGLPYFHTPIADDRIFPGAGAFTGMDLYENPVGWDEVKDAVVDLPMADLVDPDAMATRLPPTIPGDTKLVRIRHAFFGGPRMDVLRRSMHGQPDFPFRRLYETALQRRGRMPEADQALHLVLHVRLGDTVVIGLPGDRRIYMDGMKDVECFDPARMRPQIDLEDLTRFVSALSHRVPGRVMVISDGYDRTFRYLRAFRSRFGLDLDQVAAIQHDVLARLAPLEALPGVTCIIGETERTTKIAIDALANTNFVLVSHGSFARQVASCFGGASGRQFIPLQEVLQRFRETGTVDHFLTMVPG